MQLFVLEKFMMVPYLILILLIYFKTGGQSDNLLNWLGIDTCKSLQELSSDPREGKEMF